MRLALLSLRFFRACSCGFATTPAQNQKLACRDEGGCTTTSGGALLPTELDVAAWEGRHGPMEVGGGQTSNGISKKERSSSYRRPSAATADAAHSVAANLERLIRSQRQTDDTGDTG